MDWLELGSVIIALLVFSFLIFTHELGHFLFAKKCGIGVTEFSIGMGPRLLSRSIGETRYSLKCIPFGGSCAMVGEDMDDHSENSFNSKSVWARILVVAGGPMFNMLTAFLLSLVILGTAGVNPAIVYRVQDGYGAAQAGIREGDVILAVNSSPIHIGRMLDLYLLEHPLTEEDVTVTYRRGDDTCTVSYDPNREVYRLGISYYADETQPVLTDVSEGSAAEQAGLTAGDCILSIDGVTIEKGEDILNYFNENPADGSVLHVAYERDGISCDTMLTPVEAQVRTLGFEASYYREKSGAGAVIVGGFYEMEYWLRYMIMSLKMLITGQVSAKEVTGPVGIVSTISDTVEQSSSDGAFYVLLNVLNMAILLSVNLGIMNLLPIPALDGGRLLFLLVEVVRGKPVSPEKEGMVHMIGFALLMALMVFVLYQDIMRLFLG